MAIIAAALLLAGGGITIALILTGQQSQGRGTSGSIEAACTDWQIQAKVAADNWDMYVPRSIFNPRPGSDPRLSRQYADELIQLAGERPPGCELPSGLPHGADDLLAPDRF